MITTRIIPNDYDQKIIVEDLNIEIFYSLKKLCAVMYSGKSNKNRWHYRFKSPERMQQYFNQQIKEEKNRAAEKSSKSQIKRQNNSELNASEFYKPGDIIVNSWGCEQTNIEFYQVIEVLNKKIRVRQINKNYVETGFLCGYSTPIIDNFCEDSEPFLMTLKSDGKNGCYICSKSYYYYHNWDGNKMYESHYA